MKNSLLPWIGVAALALAGLSAYRLSQPSASDRANTDARARDGADHAARPVHNDAEMQRMQAALDTLQSQVSSMRASAGAQAPAAAKSTAQIRQQAEADAQRHAAYVASLQASFKLETPDPRWSSATTSRVWEAINQTDAMRDATRNVECRANTCRIEIRDDGSGRVNKSLPLWSQQFTDVLPRMVGQTVTHQNGQSDMVLYLMGPQPAPVAAPKG